MPFRIETLPEGEPATFRREHRRWLLKKGFTDEHPTERAVDDERQAVCYFDGIDGGPGYMAFSFRLFVRGAELSIDTSAQSCIDDGKVTVTSIVLPSRLLTKRAAMEQIIMDLLAAYAPHYVEPYRIFRGPDDPPVEFVPPRLRDWFYEPPPWSPGKILERVREWGWVRACRRMADSPWVRSPLAAAATFVACAASVGAAPGANRVLVMMTLLSGLWLAWRLRTYSTDYNLRAWLLGRKPQMLEVMAPIYRFTARMLEDPLQRDDVALRLRRADGSDRLIVQATNNGRRTVTIHIAAKEVARLIAAGPVPESELRPFRFPAIDYRGLRPGRSAAVVRLAVEGRQPITTQVEALIWTREGWGNVRLDRCLVWARFDEAPATPPAGS
jgi:hypothetical protein